MKRFVTEHEINGERYSGHVDAIDWSQAELIASMMNPQRRVVGVLYAVVTAGHWTQGDADKFTKAMAETGGEPPDASEFEERGEG